MANTDYGKAQKFLKSVTAQPPNDACILWPFATSPKGYGRLHYKGRVWAAHRLVLALVTGDAPNGKMALHSPHCTSRRCVNPLHLRWGSAKNNADDMTVSGTRMKGQYCPSAKISDADAQRIASSKISGKELAEQYGVSPSTVSQIRLGRVRTTTAANRPRKKTKKLSPDEVRQIYSDPRSAIAVATAFRVSRATIYAIRSGAAYGPITNSIDAPYRSKRRKLGDKQIKEILNDTRPQRAVALSYGISQSMVSLIKSHANTSEFSPST